MAFTNKLDEDFTNTMLEIEQLYGQFNKHERIRIDKWVKFTQSRKLCQVTMNPTWKRNRNQYAELLLQMVQNQNLEQPFNKVPPDGPLPQLNKSAVGILHKKIPPSKTSRPSSAQDRPIQAPIRYNLQPTPATQRVLTPKGKLEKPPQSYKVSFESPYGKQNDSKLKAKLQNAKTTEQYLREELYVIFTQQKSKIISEQNKLIEQLRAENFMLKNKKSVEKIYDKPLIKQPKGDSFYGNLDTFQKETQKLTQETQQLINKYSSGRKRKQLSSIQVELQESPRQETLEQSLLSEILGIEDIKQNMQRLNKLQSNIGKYTLGNPRHDSSPSLSYSERSEDY